MPETRLSPPWATHVSLIKALFEGDPQVRVDYNDETRTVKLYVSNPCKSDAIDGIIKHEIEFGNVVLHVQVVPPNGNDLADTILQAFDGNPAFSDVVVNRNPSMGELVYAMFKPEVVQFFNDDLGDAHGLTTLTYEQVATEVLECGAYICSDVLAK